MKNKTKCYLVTSTVIGLMVGLLVSINMYQFGVLPGIFWSVVIIIASVSAAKIAEEIAKWLMEDELDESEKAFRELDDELNKLLNHIIKDCEDPKVIHIQRTTSKKATPKKAKKATTKKVKKATK